MKTQEDLKATCKLCLIDDDPHTLEALGELCQELGHSFETYTNPEEALRVIKGPKSSYGLVICDYKMPGLDGLALYQEMNKSGIDVPVILISSHGTTELMYDSLSRGIFDFIQKPFNFRELAAVITRACKFYELQSDYQSLQKQIKTNEREDFIGISHAMKNVKEIIDRVAKTSASVLILGETGTGKELVAKSIHARGLRKNQTLVSVNCAAIPEGLIESELFGHEKGSFTGATDKKIGLFQEADAGTIFLDEIGDLPLLMQSKILRVLQEGKIRPIGSSKEIDVNVRVLAATHKDLKSMIKAGTFREDLFYRLNVVTIHVPPLRERKDDIPLLCAYFLKKFKKIHSSNVKTIENSGLNKLASYDWPGNIRELQNTIERSLVMCREPTMTDKDILMGTTHSERSIVMNDFEHLPSLKEIEKKYICHVLTATNGKREEAAKILGINRKTLYSKIKEYNLTLS